MAGYSNILVAIDFSATSDRVIERAQQVAAYYEVPLRFLHVVEYYPTFEPVGDMAFGVDLGATEQELVELSRKQMADLLKKKGAADCDSEVMVGDTKRTIIKRAQELQCDLIIVGSHGRHGLDRLLGSTADAVLQRAHCDVLAVRAGD